MTLPSSPQLPSLDKGSPIHTPPSISDREDDRVFTSGGEHSTNSPTPSTSAESFAPSPELPFTHSTSSLNTTFNDYLRRSHPDYAQPAVTTTSFQPASAAAGRWQNWSWSQLEQPRFPVGDDDDNYDDNVDEDPLDPFELFRWTSASLPFVS